MKRIWFVTIGWLCFAAITPVYTQDSEEAEAPVTRAELAQEQIAILKAIEAAGPIEPLGLLPCERGVHGPPLSFRGDAFGEEGVFEEYFDPCGLRFTDLSGVWIDRWSSTKRQMVAHHDTRTGQFQMRFSNVPEDDDYYSIWGYEFGDRYIGGVLGDVADQFFLETYDRFPIRMADDCPDNWQITLPIPYIHIGYSPDDGEPYIAIYRERKNLSGNCDLSHIEYVTHTFKRLPFGEEMQ